MDVEKCRQLLPLYQPVYLTLIENLLIKVQYPPDDVYESWSAGIVFIYSVLFQPNLNSFHGQ